MDDDNECAIAGLSPFHPKEDYIMTWDLLSAGAGVAALIAAFAEGRKAGAPGTLIGVLVGLGVGVVCFLAMRIIGKSALRRLGLYEPKLPPFRLILSWLLCCAGFAWAVISGVLGLCITRLVIHFYLNIPPK